jgi:hypothetical protein
MLRQVSEAHTKKFGVGQGKHVDFAEAVPPLNQL